MPASEPINELASSRAHLELARRRHDDVWVSNGRPWSYDRAVTHGFFRDRRPDNASVLNRYPALAMAAGYLVIVAGSQAYRAPLPLRLAVVIVMIAAFFSMMFGFLKTWEAAFIRAHLAVVDRRDLGDAIRWAIFALVLAGLPVLFLGLLLGGIAALQALAASG